MNTSSKRAIGLTAKAVVLVGVVTLLVILSLVTVGCDGQAENKAEDESDTKAKLYTVEEMRIPARLDQQKLFGLFFYNEDGETYTRSTEPLESINFDPNKPTAIFIHGMQMNNGYHNFDEIYNPIGWLDAGYNFGVFLWSQLADCGTPGNGKRHIWCGNSEFYYADENDNRVEESADRLAYPTAMVFGTYYFDLMNRVGEYNGSSISIIGHSLGANTTIALGSYFFTLLDQGTITKKYMPDRFVYLDAYMDALDDYVADVPWLNEPIGEGGVIQRGKEVADKAHALGISTEYLKSYKGVSYLSDNPLYGGEEGTCKSYFDKLLYVDMREVSSKLFQNHVDSMRFYLRQMTEEIAPVADKTADEELFPAYYDEENDEFDWKNAAINEGIVGWGATTPLSVTYARNFHSYDMGNLNAEAQYSSDIEKPVVAGFAFFDYNGNGVYDERLQARVARVKVALYEGENKIAEQTTTEAGAYLFEIDGDYAGKTYTVKATLPDGKFFTNAAVAVSEPLIAAYMTQGVSREGVSQEFSFLSDVQIKIVNIGVSPYWYDAE